MIANFGAHYRSYRLAAALDRLRELPPTTNLPLQKAARLTGIKEDSLRAVISRHRAPNVSERHGVNVGTLRAIIREARNAQNRL